jgi:hypothetical protein
VRLNAPHPLTPSRTSPAEFRPADLFSGDPLDLEALAVWEAKHGVPWDPDAEDHDNAPLTTEPAARAPGRRNERGSPSSSGRTRALIARVYAPRGPGRVYALSGLVLKEALALAERRRDPAAIAEAATYLGHATVGARDGEEGRRLLQEARQGLTLPFQKVAALTLTLLGETAASPAGHEAVRLPGLT